MGQVEAPSKPIARQTGVGKGHGPPLSGEAPFEGEGASVNKAAVDPLLPSAREAAGKGKGNRFGAGAPYGFA